ncbi:hydrogenase iron-sulfur subunit [Thermodesulfobacteriota bacterium]
MTNEQKPRLALFYCQQTPQSGENERQSLEEKYGKNLRLFPIPCSGRLEPLHLLKALEEFADAAYVHTCPEGACRYFEGNRRAGKRVGKARSIIKGIGLEEDRLGIIIADKDNRKTLAELAEEAMELASNLPPSPVFKEASLKM